MTGKTWLLASLTLAVSPSARPVTGQERSLYWGDTHVHTSYSSDAYGMGTVNADPEKAYRFAKGLPVVYPGLGHRVRLDRPLDFLPGHAPGARLHARSVHNHRRTRRQAQSRRGEPGKTGPIGVLALDEIDGIVI